MPCFSLTSDMTFLSKIVLTIYLKVRGKHTPVKDSEMYEIHNVDL